MKSVNLLLGNIAKGINYAIEEAGDSNLRIPPLLMPLSRVPYPVRRVFSASASGYFTDSFHLVDVQAMSAATNLTLINLGPGIWRLSWQHFLDQAGGVNDPSSFGDILVNWANVFGGNVTLSRIRNTQLQQRNDGEFTATVEKGRELSFLRVTTAGLGTGTGNSFFSLEAEKLF